MIRLYPHITLLNLCFTNLKNPFYIFTFPFYKLKYKTQKRKTKIYICYPKKGVFTIKDIPKP